jgi:hypothetical protein
MISVFTGTYIYQEIKRKSEEMTELNRAMDELERGSLPWNLLKREYEARKAEWQQLNNTKYVVK